MLKINLKNLTFFFVINFFKTLKINIWYNKIYNNQYAKICFENQLV
jgi:hypothetical protein